MARELTIWEAERDADNESMPFYGFLQGGHSSSIRHPGIEIENLAKACAANNYEYWDIVRSSKETDKFISAFKTELTDKDELTKLDRMLISGNRLVVSIG